MDINDILEVVDQLRVVVEVEGESRMSTTGYTQQIGGALETVRGAVCAALADPGADAQALLELVRVVDGAERTMHGLMLQVLARADQIKAAPGGMSAWLTSELCYQPGRGRALAQDARRIGSMPGLAQKLTAGELGRDATRVLSRAEHAIKGTPQESAVAVAQALAVLESGGIGQAEDHVRALEHTIDPGRAEDLRCAQRSRSFARVSELPEGMCRFEVLLDAGRATLVRTAIDVQVAAFLRARQYDHTEQVPGDVQSTEQLGAEAFTRLAEVFLTATDTQRAERYGPAVVFYAPARPDPDSAQESTSGSASTTAPIPPIPPVPPGCVQTAYGALIPMQQSAALHLTLDPTGQPVTLDGHLIDQDPEARLATPAQRLALAYRDRRCTFPGCARPPTWSLHAHHSIAYSQGGPTTLPNMRLLCPQHHTMEHH